MAFQSFPLTPLNSFTDSACVADITQKVDQALLKGVNSAQLFGLLKTMWHTIQARPCPYYILHVRRHTNLPGFISERSAQADHLAGPAWTAPQLDMLAQAKASPAFFHQGIRALQRQFLLSSTEVHNTVNPCADCQGHTAPLQMGVYPRGLKALQMWQTDVTHIHEFGKLKYVHVQNDTFSSHIWASVHSGEKGRDVIEHWRLTFAALGIPCSINTDNGPAYSSQKTKFLQVWGVAHQTGIPQQATGQAIVERALGTLKHMLEKQKGGMCGETPPSKVAKASLNHLAVPEQSQNPVIFKSLPIIAIVW